MKQWQTEAAFVIQLRPEADPGAGRLAGRVEHIASYKAARFDSVDELLAFMASVLAEIRPTRQP